MTKLNEDLLKKYFGYDFEAECSELLNEIISDELSKPDDEADFDLIDECTEILVMLAKGESYNASEILASSETLINKINSKKRKISAKPFKILLIAAVIAATGISANAAVTNITGQSIIEHLTPFDSTTLATVENEETLLNDNPITTAISSEKDAGGATEKTTESSTNGSKIEFSDTTNKGKIVFADDETTNLKQKKKSNRVSESTSKTEKKKTTESKTETITTQPVTEPSPVPIKMEIMRIKGAFKNEYRIGEEFSSKGIYPIIIMSDGTKKTIDISECEIEGFDSSVEGIKNVKLRYGKVSSTFEIRVTED